MGKSRAQALVEPNITAGILYAAEFHEFVGALSERLDATLEPPRGAASPGTGVIPVEFALHLAGDIAPYVVPFIVEKIGETLMARMRRRGRDVPLLGVIYGPDGKVLREVRLNTDD